MIAASKGFTKWAGLILAVSLPLISTQAHAVSVTVGGTAYEIGVLTGSYNTNSAILPSQPWWGDIVAARAFRDALVLSNSMTPSFMYYFAYSATTSVGLVRAANYNGFIVADDNNAGFNYQANGVGYATATASAASVPEINAGSLSQALLMLFALWLVTWRRTSSRVA